jgi:hypothetical protein
MQILIFNTAGRSYLFKFACKHLFNHFIQKKRCNLLITPYYDDHDT